MNRVSRCAAYRPSVCVSHASPVGKNSSCCVSSCRSLVAPQARCRASGEHNPDLHGAAGALRACESVSAEQASPLPCSQRHDNRCVRSAVHLVPLDFRSDNNDGLRNESGARPRDEVFAEHDGPCETRSPRGGDHGSRSTAGRDETWLRSAGFLQNQPSSCAHTRCLISASKLPNRL